MIKKKSVRKKPVNQPASPLISPAAAEQHIADNEKWRPTGYRPGGGPGLPDGSDNEQQSLDWVYDQTLRLLATMDQEDVPNIDVYGAVFRDLWLMIPQTTTTFGSGHDFPIRAAYFELQTSITLALRGLYRYAFIALRSALELGLLSAYYNRQVGGHLKIQKWLHSKEDTPNNGIVDNELGKAEKMRDFDTKFDWFKQLRALRTELNGYTHSKGISYSSTGAEWSSLPMVVESLGATGPNERRLTDWMGSLANVVRLVAVPHVLMYPLATKGIANTWSSSGAHSFPAGMLDPIRSDRLNSIFTKDEQAYFKASRSHSTAARKWLAYLERRSGLDIDRVFSDGGVPWKLEEMRECAEWLERQRKRYKRPPWDSHDLEVFRHRVAFEWLLEFAPEKLAGVNLEQSY